MSSQYIIEYYVEFGNGKDLYSEFEKKSIADAIKTVSFDWIEAMFAGRGYMESLEFVARV